MTEELTISIGQCSQKGRKAVNQDFHGALLPTGLALASKGIAIAIADGISSSSVSRIAAESAIKSLLTDYFCTPDTWSVKTSAQRVISAANSWAHAQTRRSQHAYDMDRGYVCTLSALVLKGRSAHIFHIGDSRIYRMSGGSFEQLTNDHRTILSSRENYLGRAVGMAQNIEIDYQQFGIDCGDIFVLATDGVYEHMDEKFIAQTIADHPQDLDHAADVVAGEAFRRGSPDNLTLQIVRVDAVPDGDLAGFIGDGHRLPPPPLLEARQEFDGYKILRPLHSNHRSHIYLACDLETGERVALKIPSIDLREDEACIKRFLLEEWIARRISNTHVLKPAKQTRPRKFIYIVSEYVEGQTLAQWMIDNPKPKIETVRLIIEQIAKGLRAFHRKEMLHQDLRPENIMMDAEGTVKIIDFGSARVAGVDEAGPAIGAEPVLGTLQYTAPECFAGDASSRQSDFFSLGVIAYHMLTGRLPYGTRVAGIRTRAQQRKLRYISACNNNPHIPEWVDGVLQKATHPDPLKRYEALTEFITDQRKPNPDLIRSSQPPLAQRNPAAFWQGVSFILALIIAVMLYSNS